MINELKNGFLVAYRVLMCLPIAVSWMLLYGLIWLSYGGVRGDMFIAAWNAFAANDTPVDPPEYQHCALDPSGPAVCKKGTCGCG